MSHIRTEKKMRLKWWAVYARRPGNSVPLGKQKNTKTWVREQTLTIHKTPEN